MDPALLGLTTPGGRTETKPRHRQPFTAVTGAREALRCYEGMQHGGLACLAWGLEKSARGRCLFQWLGQDGRTNLLLSQDSINLLLLILLKKMIACY